MRRRLTSIRLLTGVLATLLVGRAECVSAQAGPEALPRWFGAVSAGAQVTSTSPTADMTYKLNGEDAAAAFTYKTKALPAADVHVAYRAWRRLVVGLGVSVAAGHSTVDVDARLPHPFLFSEPRQVEGSAGSLTHTEVMVSVDAGWLFPVSRRLDAVVFAGPAYFVTTQEVAIRVQYDDQYPYDTATFTGVDTDSTRPTGLGVTIGANLEYRLTKAIGVGALLRYSRATITVDPLGDGQSFRMNPGGIQTAVGLRVRF
jgi:hypothetical protein